MCTETVMTVVKSPTWTCTVHLQQRTMRRMAMKSVTRILSKCETARNFSKLCSSLKWAIACFPKVLTYSQGRWHHQFLTDEWKSNGDSWPCLLTPWLTNEITPASDHWFIINSNYLIKSVVDIFSFLKKTYGCHSGMWQTHKVYLYIFFI